MTLARSTTHHINLTSPQSTIFYSPVVEAALKGGLEGIIRKVTAKLNSVLCTLLLTTPCDFQTGIISDLRSREIALNGNKPFSYFVFLYSYRPSPGTLIFDMVHNNYTR
jgi:hypothetical protein